MFDVCTSSFIPAPIDRVWAYVRDFNSALYPLSATTAMENVSTLSERWRMKNLGLALIFACVVVPESTHAQNAYITNLGSNTVSVIATATNTVVGSPIPVGLSPLGVAVTPDRSKVYVTNHAS